MNRLGLAPSAPPSASPTPPHEWGGQILGLASSAPPSVEATPLHEWGGQIVDWARIVDVLGYSSAGLGILIESSRIPFPGEALPLAAAEWAASWHHSLRLVIVSGVLVGTAIATVC